MESAVLTADQSGLHRAAPVHFGLPPGAENADSALAATPSLCPQGSSGVLQASNQKDSLSPGRKPEETAKKADVLRRVYVGCSVLGSRVNRALKG